MSGLTAAVFLLASLSVSARHAPQERPRHKTPFRVINLHA